MTAASTATASSRVAGVTTVLAEDACAAGSTIELRVYPGMGNSGAVEESLDDAVPFVRKALAEEPIPGQLRQVSPGADSVVSSTSWL